MKGVTRARSTKRRRNAKRSDKDERGKCTRGTGAEESEEGKRREKDGKEDETAKGEVERERGKRGRERTSGNGSIESAAQRNAPPLLWSGSFAGTHHRVRVRQKEREREKDGERGIASDQYRRRGRTSQADSRWARSGLPEFHTLLCVCHPKRPEGGDQPPSKKG